MNKKNFAAKILKEYLKQLAKEKQKNLLVRILISFHLQMGKFIGRKFNWSIKGQEIINPAIKLFFVISLRNIRKLKKIDRI